MQITQVPVQRLAIPAPSGVSNSWMKSSLPLPTSLSSSLRASSFEQWTSTCLGVSKPPPQLQRPDSIPGTQALFKKK